MDTWRTYEEEEMSKAYIKKIPQWEKEYLESMRGNLSKQQIELLEGRDIKAHEGMIYGEMYSDWKFKQSLSE